MRQLAISLLAFAILCLLGQGLAQKTEVVNNVLVRTSVDAFSDEEETSFSILPNNGLIHGFDIGDSFATAVCAEGRLSALVFTFDEHLGYRQQAAFNYRIGRGATQELVAEHDDADVLLLHVSALHEQHISRMLGSAPDIFVGAVGSGGSDQDVYNMQNLRTVMIGAGCTYW